LGASAEGHRASVHRRIRRFLSESGTLSLRWMPAAPLHCRFQAAFCLRVAYLREDDLLCGAWWLPCASTARRGRLTIGARLLALRRAYGPPRHSPLGRRALSQQRVARLRFWGLGRARSGGGVRVCGPCGVARGKLKGPDAHQYAALTRAPNDGSRAGTPLEGSCRSLSGLHGRSLQGVHTSTFFVGGSLGRCKVYGM